MAIAILQCMIYALIDPRTMLINYVGKTENGCKRRYHRHLWERDQEAYQTLCKKWLRDLKMAGFDPIIHMLDATCTRAELATEERWWIAYGRALSWPLTNMTHGGDGVSGRKLTDEQKARISAGLRGHSPSMESRKKMSKSASNPSPERRAEMSYAARNRSDETKAKMYSRFRCQPVRPIASLTHLGQ